MSAITGIFYRDGRYINHHLITKINDKLSHRGPDMSSTWYEGPVGLGHQMLCTTPESLHEKLPFEENSIIITADARIDNREELSVDLGIDNKENIADSYFILKAYQKWGEECPNKLLGDFSFAIWDKNEETLFCARDHMGIKPFYYYLNDDLFIFGTEIKSILSIDEVPIKLNEKKIALFLTKDMLDDKLTFYKNIYSLPAANFMKICKKNYITEKYWELNSDLNIRMDSEEEYAKAFQDIFAESVRCRLRSHFPIGFELSGGLDSSSITCMAQKLLEEKSLSLNNVNSFSIIYDEITDCDESYYIKKVLNKHEIKAYFTKGDNISPLDDINKLLSYQDQPFFSPHMANQIKSYKKMKEKNIRVLFSGEGGDQIVSHGTNYIRELALTFKWKKLLRELKGLSNNYNETKFKIFIRIVIFPFIPYHIKKLIRIILRTNTDSFLDKEFLKTYEIETEDKIIEKFKSLNTRQNHYFSIKSSLNQTIFGIMDRSISNFNMEERYPFFDKRLVEFCYGIPSDMKIKYGWNRYVLRLAMENILPPEIQWRKTKANLGSVYKRNLMLFEKYTIETLIYRNNEIISNYVNIQKLQEIYEKSKNGKNSKLFDIWLVILLSIWLKNTKHNF